MLVQAKFAVRDIREHEDQASKIGKTAQTLARHDKTQDARAE